MSGLDKAMVEVPPEQVNSEHRGEGTRGGEPGKESGRACHPQCCGDPMDLNPGLDRKGRMSPEQTVLS